MSEKAFTAYAEKAGPTYLAFLDGMEAAAQICGSLAETTYDDTDGFEAATGCEASIMRCVREGRKHEQEARAPTPPAAEPSAPSLHAAVHAFLAKIDECQPHIDDAFLHRQLRCGPYTGPTYGVELEALRSAHIAEASDVPWDSKEPRQPDQRVAAGGEALREAAVRVRERMNRDVRGMTHDGTDFGTSHWWTRQRHDDIRMLLAAAEPAVQREEVVEVVKRFRHVKRGTVYEFVGDAELQMSAPVVDGSKLVIYRGDDDKLWAREVGEFMDGRFDPLPDHIRTLRAPSGRVEKEVGSNG